MLSVIVPAFNEEKYLPATLAALRTAAANLSCELVVVDNASIDRTRDVAEYYGAVIVSEPIHNIAAVKNAGARAATGDVLVFIDADTIVPTSLLVHIADAMRVSDSVGGAVAVDYAQLDRTWLSWYLKGWAFWSRFFNMKQGAAQFCRRSVFQKIGGYDDTLYMGEDIDFYWRLSRYARRSGGVMHYIEEPRVVTSSRRFNNMKPWKVIVLTHPVVIWLSWKRRLMWKDWYDRPIR